MRLQSIKKESELSIPGATLLAEWEGGTLKSVAYTFADGKILKFQNDSYSFKALTNETPKTVKRHRVSGTVIGLPVQEDFESAFEATVRKQELESKSSETADLKVTEIEVPEEL